MRAEATVATEEQTGSGGRQEAASASAIEPSGHSDGGSTNIADAVVTKIAGIAAREVPGVHDLGGGAARAMGSMTQRVGLGDERTQGVSVEVGEREAAVDLTLVVDYGESIPQVAEAIRSNIVKRVEGITGLSVTEVNISVNDLYFPGDDDRSTEEQTG